MKKFILVLLISISVSFLNASQPKLENTEISALYKTEKLAMQNYRAEKYAQAHEQLIKTAPLGFKQSQYYLAFLYLKGQHVKKDMLEGMGWLGVAKESGYKEMVTLYKQLYTVFNQAQKDAVDKKVAEYIALYGMQEQNVVCNMRAKGASRKRILMCEKIPIGVEREPELNFNR